MDGYGYFLGQWKKGKKILAGCKIVQYSSYIPSSFEGFSGNGSSVGTSGGFSVTD